MALAEKHRRFVAEYLKDLNATQAAIRAGYSEKTAKQQGSRLLTNADIASAVSAGQAKALERAELSATRVLEEMRRLAFVSVADLFDTDGNLLPIHKLPREVASAVASVEVVKKNLAAGDGQTDTVHKLKTWDKPKALDMLGKHFGLLTEQLQVNGVIDITSVLKERHARHRKSE